MLFKKSPDEVLISYDFLQVVETIDQSEEKPIKAVPMPTERAALRDLELMKSTAKF